MNCPKCGEVLKDDAKFCGSCGFRLEDAQTTDTAPNSEIPRPDAKQGSKTKNAEVTSLQISKIFGLVVGTILIIIGFIRISNASIAMTNMTFGADFYTYAYQGIITVAHQLVKINGTVGWLIVAIGAAIDVISLQHK